MNYLRAIDEVFRQFKEPHFSIKFWDGTKREYGAGESNAFTLVIKDEKTAKRLLGGGSLGFGESYMDGSLRVEGDLDEYLLLRHRARHFRPSLKLLFASFIAKHGRRKSKDDRQKNISYHYDLGNDFFGLYLDKDTMSYSAGLYQTGSESLAEAQIKKLEFTCRSLGLPQGASVLDLGSGWGGFARYAAQVMRWKVTGWTLSEKQLQYCRDMAEERGLEDRIAFEYRDMLTNMTTKQFDGIVMLESVEHVAKERLPGFFRSLYAGLVPDGRLVLQLTGRHKPRRVDRWTLKYVFPGGYLPAREEIFAVAKEAGFVLEEFRDDTQDYVRTMSEWIHSIEEHRAEVERMFDQPFYRLWELWTHGARVNFETGAMSLFRIRLRRPL